MLDTLVCPPLEQAYKKLSTGVGFAETVDKISHRLSQSLRYETNSTGPLNLTTDNGRSGLNVS